MTKRKASKQDKQAASVEILNEIENIARTVAHGYPITAERYQAERISEQKFGDCPPGDPLYKFCQEQAATTRRHMLMSEAVCAEWREKMSRLALLVRRHLPEFPASLRDGRLCHVVFAPEWWEQKPLAEWEPLLVELARIEEAAIGAAEPIDDDKPVAKRGRKEVPTEVLIERVRFARTHGTSAACTRFNKTPGAVSRWKESLLKRGIDPEALS